MRCPKCGYISFDHLETCTKCGKDISSLIGQLTGTVFKAEAPAFLRFEVQEGNSEAESPDHLAVAEDIDLEFSLEGEELLMEEEPAAGEHALTDVSPAAEVEADDDFDFQLTDEEGGELVLETGDDGLVEDGEGPEIDFSELDISDLGPPEEEDEEAAMELSLEDGSEDTAAPAAASGAPLGGGGTLEDLQTEGLDLGMPSLPPAGSSSGKKLRPGVKTGTALDEFDIDLGELLSDKSK
jgi:hypothetical protein